MPMHFSRSLRRLDAQHSRRSVLAAVTLLSLLAAWSLWFTRAKVAIYSTSSTARIEVNQEHYPVATPVAGRVVVGPPPAGQFVRAGDVLLEIDASPERLAQSQMLSRITPSARQLQAVRDEIAAQQRALEEEAQGAAAARGESSAKARESAAAADYAADEAQRLRALHASGIVSELEALRAAKLADQRRNVAETDAFATARIDRDFQARREDRLARIARLNNEIAIIDASRSDALAGSRRLTYDIDQRVVRAPISGLLAEISTLKVGSLVPAGEQLCTIVPEGVLKVVAFFQPATAIGRIREGQRARVRLEGFPWTQYGTAAAVVSEIAAEVRDGSIRVELSLTDGQSGVALQHGLPAEVDVQTELLSPLAMVLRSAGEKLRVHAASTAALPDAR